MIIISVFNVFVMLDFICWYLFFSSHLECTG